MTIYILPEELLVGNRSSKLVAVVIPIERGEFNIILKMDLKNVVKRDYKPFLISKEERKELMKDIMDTQGHLILGINEDHFFHLVFLSDKLSTRIYLQFSP